MKKQPTVYFAPIRMKNADPNDSLPAKFERLLKKCNLRRLCQGQRVPIKIHVGGNLGFTTIHPLLVRTVVEAVKEAGGKPFIVEGCFEPVTQAASRGYTAETLGCPILSAGGPYDSHWVTRKVDYPGLDEIQVFGAIWDAPCLINLSHVKGHGNCGYGGACKNIAMGCVTQASRAKIHAQSGMIDWHADRCTACGLCVKACDTGALTLQRKPKKVNIFWHDCRFCLHCVNACPQEALTVRDADGFQEFQECMAITTKTVLDSFKPGRVLHINVLTDITMLCDCWGFSSANVVPDIGILASHDMVAVETASLRAIRAKDFIPGSLIGTRRRGKGKHLFEQIHAKDPFVQIRALERRGMGQSRYQLVEIE